MRANGTKYDRIMSEREAKARRMIGNNILTDTEIATCCGLTYKAVSRIREGMKLRNVG